MPLPAIFAAQGVLSFARYWRIYAFGGVIILLVIYHSCAIKKARQEGIREGETKAVEAEALKDEAALKMAQEEEARKKKLWEARQSALNEQAFRLDDLKKQFSQVQTDFLLTVQRASRSFERNMSNATREASNVSDADLIPFWDALISEHERLDSLDARADPSHGSDLERIIGPENPPSGT